LAAVPLLGLLMPPSLAVPIAIGLQLFGSLLDFRGASKVCHWPTLRWLMIGALVGSPVGTLVLSTIPAPVARLAISGISLFAVIVLGRGFTLSIVPGRATTSTVGFGAGIFNGLAGMPGPLAVAYYLSVPLTREAARASLLVFFLMTSIAALAASMISGLLTPQTVALSVLGLPVMWIGTRLGEIAFSRGTSDMHRRVSIVVLGVIAIMGAVQGMCEIA
jgi:uncharacterized protein